MNASELKQAARKFGADLVGIASAEAFAHLPERNRPETVSDRVKSVVVVGHRILRGALRGVEEGTNFGSTYQTYGFSWMEDLFLSRTVYHLTCFLEDAGVEAIPFLAHRNPDDAFEPDYKAAAEAAGLGSIGKGGFFLTPQYGHRQRFALILTDFAFEPDHPRQTGLCRGCRACLESCPLGALSEAGEGRNFRLDESVCAGCRNGAYTWPGRSDRADRYAAACQRACLVALENKITGRYEHKFRKRSVWSIGPVAQEKQI